MQEQIAAGKVAHCSKVDVRGVGQEVTMVSLYVCAVVILIVELRSTQPAREGLIANS
jgi:hypothetical protein